ncbi:MAG: PspC domain-containing protein [bacterium]|nr:PspC domain-containing protein [bacterium]
MHRSFTERVFGGVCGGLGAALRLNPWLLRVLFAGLTLISLGAFAVVYVLLWWIVPQQSFVERRRGFPTLLALLLVIAVSAAWVVTTFNLAPLPFSFGIPPFWAGAAVLLGVVFVLRQFRG